jgi:hypothetical protein
VPEASAAAAGARMSRPWKVALAPAAGDPPGVELEDLRLGGEHGSEEAVVGGQERVPAVERDEELAAGADSGSTTATWTVPSGKKA